MGLKHDILHNNMSNENHGINVAIGWVDGGSIGHL